MKQLNKQDACKLLNISVRTLENRMKLGTITFTKEESTSGFKGHARVSFTYEGLGLVDPDTIPAPSPKSGEPSSKFEEPPQFALRVLSDTEQKKLDDEEFARAYRAGEVPDSAGNYVNGTNDRWETKSVSLLGPTDDINFTQEPVSGTAHMDPALLSDWVAPGTTPMHNPQVGTGTTRSGTTLAAGYNQEQYNADMNAWRRARGAPSMSDQREAIERSKSAINESFNTVRR